MREEIFITKAFENFQRHYRLESVVSDFLYNIKDTDKLRYIEEYDEYGFYLPNEQFPRVVFLKEEREGITLFVPRCDFPDEYKWLNYNHNTDYSKDEKEQIKNYCLSLKARPVLPLEMMDYEKKRNFSNTLTSYVYETSEWCISIQKKELDEYRFSIFEKIKEIVFDKNYIYNKNKWSENTFSNGLVLYFYVKELAGHTYFFLLDITNKTNAYHLDRYAKLRTNIDLLVKSSCKGYPDWVLCMDYPEWKELEFDDKCNFALSEEEIDVLNYSQYPIFINGLAGSGKSTVLYYLFSHIYINYVLNNSQKDKRPFLFLTYSEALKDKSYDSIKSLIRSILYHRGYSKTVVDNRKLLKKLDGSFYSFRDFLRTNFLSVDEMSLFLDENHIDIVKFKELYNQCTVPNHNKFSYIKIWSQIRNIKGKKCIDQNHRFFEYYRWYNSILKDNNIEKNNKSSYWDDLSLIRYVVDNKIEKLSKKKKFNIIFCDEAQDFTEIEIYLIMSLSKYIDYDLSQFPNIPFAFAGDPNQTISPTGFNWSHLKNTFNDSFRNQIGSHIQLSDQQLEYNYRSKASIVALANSLQYINNRYLSEDTLKPQKVWNSLPGKTPSFYYIEDNKDLLYLGFEKCVTITSDDGEYRLKPSLNEFTEDSTPISDPILRDWLDNVDNKEKKKNILTPLTAKGLEYPSVLLYKFADLVPDSFVKILNEPNSIIDKNTDEWYECSSFLTKLYIAVSQAKSALYIFDTREGYEKFWKHFEKNVFVGNLIKNSPEEKKWCDEISQKPLCGGIEIGESDEFVAEVNNDFNLLQIAINLKSSAKDSQGYIRAAGFYKQAGYDNESKECIAWSYFFNSEYQKAGELFEKLEDTEEKKIEWRKLAVRSYWKGCCWSKLENCNNNKFQKLLSLYMLDRKQFVDLAKNDMKFFSDFRSDDLTYISVANQILKDTFKGLVRNDLPKVIEALNVLIDRGFNGFVEKKAKLYFNYKEWEKAIKEWNRAKEIDDLFEIPAKDYNFAQEKFAEQEGRINDIILWKNINGKSREILKDYGEKSAKEIGLTSKSIAIIFNSFIKEGKFNKALNYEYYKGSDKYQRLYDMDKSKFIVDYVLNDKFEVSTSEKYYEWVENKVRRGDTSLFCNGLTKDVVSQIFKSESRVDNMPIWAKFMSLRDIDRHRIFIDDNELKYTNISFITDSILEKINSQHNIYIDSCFIEIMFNDNWYNYDRVRQDSFLRIDWDKFSIYGNDYFKECGLWVSDLEDISKNIRAFINKFLSKYLDKKTTNPDTENDIKTLLKAFYKAVPRNYENPNDSSKLLDNWQVAVDFCKKYADRFSKKSQRFKEFFAIEGFKLGCQYKSVDLSEYYKLFSDVQIDKLAKDLEETRHLTLVRKLLSKRNAPKSLVLNIAKWAYLYDLKVSRLESNEKSFVKELSTEFIDYILSAQELNDESKYNLKLISYLLELIIESHKEIESLYHKMAEHALVSTDLDLVEYFKKRAYSEKLSRPLIEFGVSNSVVDKSEPLDKETVIEGVTINPQGGRLKKVEFFDDDEIATIKKGKLDDDFDVQKVESKSETEFTILEKIHVSIISENEVRIRYKNKHYKVVFE